MNTWQMTELWSALTLLFVIFIFFRLGSILNVLKEIASNTKYTTPAPSMQPAPTRQDEETIPVTQSDLLLQVLHTCHDDETLRNQLYILTTGGTMTKEESALVNELLKLPNSEIRTALRKKIGA